MTLEAQETFRKDNLDQLKKDIRRSLQSSGASKVKNIWSHLSNLQKQKDDLVSEAGKSYDRLKNQSLKSEVRKQAATIEETSK